MLTRLCTSVLLIAAFLATSAPAQVATGNYPFASFDNLGFDSINIGNLNIRFSIPIRNKAGRAGMDFRYNLVYDGLIWSPQTVNGVQSWVPDGNMGWKADTNVVLGYVIYNQSTVTCMTTDGSGRKYTATLRSNYRYVDSLGGTHNPILTTGGCVDENNPTVGTSDDGYTVDANQHSVTFPSGKISKPPFGVTSGAGTVTDTNGNQISATSSSFTDTLGTTVLQISGAAPNPVSFTYTDLAGHPQAATLTYRSYTVRTNFATGIPEYGPQSVSLVDSLTLADGSSYHFTYEPTSDPAYAGDVTGRLVSVTLPTGGVITYGYLGYGLNTDGTTGALTRLTSDSSTPRTYTRSVINSNATTTTVTDPSGNQSVYAFTIDAAYHRFFETRRFVYNNPANGSGLTLGRFTCYNGATPNCDGSPVTTPISTVDTVESINGGKQTETLLYYSSIGNFLGQTDLDFDRSTTLKYSQYTYQQTGSIGNLVSSAIVRVTPGQTVSDTEYRYDGTALAPTSGIPQHVPVTGNRGNLTSVTQSVLIGGATLQTTNTYDDTGTLLSTTGPTGTTQLSYESTHSYPTQVIPPTSVSGVALPVSYGYEVTTGLMTSNTDPNGAATSTPAADALLRPTTISYSDGGTTTYVYRSPMQTGILHTLDGSGRSAQQEILVDSYGRQSRNAIFNGQSTNPWYQNDFCYDANGRLGFASYRYQGVGFAAAPVCSGAGDAYAYDAMGRVTLVTHGDGTTLKYTYKDRAFQVTDESGSSRITQTDALGRTTAVCEISSGAGMAGANTPVNCGTDIPGTGFLTTYAYDLVNHKTTVTQGVQKRIFQTDALGRTVSVQEPEMLSPQGQGQTTYSYSYAAPNSGLGLIVTRARPAANQVNPSTLTTTTTQYDTLGRVVSINYSDGITPTRSFSYDTVNGGAAGRTNLMGRVSVASTLAPNQTIPSTVTQYSYDPMGRVLTMLECEPSGCGNAARARTLTFTYDQAGNLTNQSDPSAGSINYGRSTAGEITSITNGAYNDATNPGNLVSSVQNGPFGPTGYVLGNGLGVNITYDSSGRVQWKFLCHNQLTAYYCDPPNGSQQVWGMYSNWLGNHLTGSSDTAAGYQGNYQYDEFDRLKSMTNPISGQTVYSYTYDLYGNRWSQNALQGGQMQNAAYDATSNRITTPGYAYDAAGNLINDSFHTYTYDAEGNVLSVDGGQTASYVYDALNQRVQVKTPGSTLEYTYDFAGRRVTTWDANANFGVQGQIWWGSLPIAFRSIDNSVYFQQQDWLGTERVRTNYAGAMVNLFTSLPFGDASGQNGTSGTDQNNFHFAGLEHDSGNTDHAQFRQYSNAQGRWMSMDPYAGSYDLSNPQSLNRYSYALNQPLSTTDRTGLIIEAPTSGGGSKCIAEIYCPAGGGSGGGAGWSDPWYGPCCGVLGGNDVIYCGNLCSLVGQSVAGANGVDFTLLGGVNGLVWINDANGQELDSAGAEELGLPGGSFLGFGAFGAPSNTATAPPCQAKILNATNNRFGTNYTDGNVNSTFNYSTGAPPGQGTLNLNVYGSTAGVSTGYYPVNWWTYAIGYGSTLHVVSGPGGHGGLDSTQTLQFGPNQATFHIDSGFPYNPIGLFSHWLLNMTKAGGYPAC